MPRCQIPAILHIKRRIKLSINISASSDQICAVLGLFKSSKLGLSSDIVLCDLAEWMAQNCFTKFVLHIFNYICTPPITNNTLYFIYGSRINWDQYITRFFDLRTVCTNLCIFFERPYQFRQIKIDPWRSILICLNPGLLGDSDELEFL